MISRLRPLVMAGVVLVALSGCRQADGPLPAAVGEASNRIGDISRDLTSVARGDQQAQQDLADDLKVFVDKSDALSAVDELAKQTFDVLMNRPLSEEDAQRLAHHLWIAVAGRELSSHQVSALQNDVQALFVSLGVPENEATEIAAQVGEVQTLVTDRPRRWYEFF